LSEPLVASDQIDKLGSYCDRLKDAIDAIAIYPRTPLHDAFDRVALQSVSKAFGLVRSCLVLLSSGFPDEAYGSSRSLVECSANLRYLTQDRSLRDERTQAFINFNNAEKRYWLEEARTHVSDLVALAEVERYAEETRIKQLEPDARLAKGHWTHGRGFMGMVTNLDHPLDASTNPLKLRKAAYSIDYHEPSAYVHCSQWALDNYCPAAGIPYTVCPSSQGYHNTAQKTLFILTTYLHATVVYAIYGLGYDGPPIINELFSERIAELAGVESLSSSQPQLGSTPKKDRLRQIHNLSYWEHERHTPTSLPSFYHQLPRGPRSTGRAGRAGGEPKHQRTLPRSLPHLPPPARPPHARQVA